MKKVISVFALLVLALPAVSLADSNVTASADNGSTISPSGLTVVPTGFEQFFGIGADLGSKITNVSFDGISEGVTNSLGVVGAASDPINHTIVVTSEPVGGNSMIFCSGPMAPGYTVGQVGGGCGGTKSFYQLNQKLPDGTLCEFWSGCMY